jgi:hypothetical protein
MATFEELEQLKNKKVVGHIARMHKSHQIKQMEKQIMTDLMLTKEAFEEYALRLRIERAKEFGMTLEQWDNAIANGSVVQTLNHNTPPSNNTQHEA